MRTRRLMLCTTRWDNGYHHIQRTRQVPGFTPQGPDGPLQPVDPDNPSSGYWPPALPSDPTTDTTIEYKADEQKATITYIDDVTGDTLVVDTITGGSD